ISGTVRPARGDLTFRKTSGAAWASVSASGTVSGSPATTDGVGTASVGVEAVDSDGRRTTTTVSIPVRAATQPLVGELKVMSFNLWYGGTNTKDYRTKQLRFLLSHNVDVVGFQETYSTSARELATLLGWHYYQASYSLGLVSRYPITAQDSYSSSGTMYGAGVRIRLDAKYDKHIVLWTAHLNYTPYGPYDACNSHMTVRQILRREEQSGRPRQIAGILNRMAGAIADAPNTPVFLVGDFNTPSHLDWTAATKDTHCGYEIAWPTTVKVAEAGLRDSYRVAHPDPLRDPGNTWSPIEVHDPQDRIDFVDFAGPVTVVDSTELTAGAVDPEDPANNEWTSDHRAVLTTFRL
ncbi:MAG: endonuclease/exonuclease/phosphatase family protein, partial [Micromonosporaceae bacterium]